VPAATGALVYSGLGPPNGVRFTAPASVRIRVTTTDDSGIASVTAYYGTKTGYLSYPTTRVNNEYSYTIIRPTGTRYWYFVIIANDGEVRQTTIQNMIILTAP
jgi:hypothetical protein